MLPRRLFPLLLTLLLFPSLNLCINQEGAYLLQAKLAFNDPNAALADWNSTDATPCNWNRVVCDSDNGNVLSLDLSASGLAGPFPSILCRLDHLAFISFADNFINSTLLDDDLALCSSLEQLNLSENYLTGPLPSRLADLPNLKFLDLTGNNFSGDIPESYGTFPKLEVLSLVENLLGGTIPAFLGNVSTLRQLNLSYNPFSPGRIPPELGNLTHLEVLWLTETNLVGVIPDSLGRLGRLIDLDLAYNWLTGSIPSSLTELTNVVQVELYNNSLIGELPTKGWSNMTALRLLDASMNQLTGSIPPELCELPLESLNLYENNLRGELPHAIANSPNLYELRLFQNQLSGELPPNLGKTSPLKWLDLSTNNFSGSIPETLCSNGVLEELLLIQNSFSGKIPAELAKCRTMLRVRLGQNIFSGEVPAEFWGLPRVSLLELSGNSFSGGIGKMISGALNLSRLILSGNNFSGEIPGEIGLADKLLEVSVNDNRLTGPLPSSILNLGQLVKLDVHNNGLSGKIPSGLHAWKKLSELNLASNEFSGGIPDDIGDLPVLNYLDFSGNQFSGKIPIALQNLKLNQLNLSNNRLSGDIPPLYTKKMYRESFLGNPGLCDDNEGLCGRGDRLKTRGFVWLLRSMFIFAGLLLLVAVIWFYIKYLRFKKTDGLIDKSKWTLMSFHKLGFSENEILDALDEDNVIGTGSSGKVYKVMLSNGESVAVKKLWGNQKPENDVEKGCNVKINSFDAEVETLGKIRHKNIIKLWCCCTTKDCKLLVYEYMPNGSLADLLHSTKSGLLDWPIRFKIAMDAAEGLSYLHHDCMPPIVHRDVKTNNILLDAEYSACITDFGVAKVGGNKSMSVIAGSYGYIAPEYAYTMRVNEKSDVYSFGIVLLELVTGKLPVDPEYGEKDLVRWVRTTLDQKGVYHVIDPKLDSCFENEMCRVLNVGLLCTSPLPINRPSMRRVVKMLQEIGGHGHKGVEKDGKLSPYYYNEESSNQGSVA